MLNKFKESSLLTKILYLLALILFLVWVIPSMMGYYSQVNKYQENVQKIEQSFSKFGLEKSTQKFNVESFKQEANQLFESVNVKSLSNKKYAITLKMKKDDIKKFNEFVEKLSLRFYVQVVGALEFDANEKEIDVKMTLLEL